MKPLKVALISLFILFVGLTSSYYLGKQTSDKWWQVHGPTYDYPAYGHQTIRWYGNPITPDPLTCGNGWTEEVKGYCSVIVPGSVVPQDNPKHKGIACHYSPNLNKTLCVYKLEDQK